MCNKQAALQSWFTRALPQVHGRVQIHVCKQAESSPSESGLDLPSASSWLPGHLTLLAQRMASILGLPEKLDN